MLMAACSARSFIEHLGAADRAPFTLKVAHLGVAAGPPSRDGRGATRRLAIAGVSYLAMAVIYLGIGPPTRSYDRIVRTYNREFSRGVMRMP